MIVYFYLYYCGAKLPLTFGAAEFLDFLTMKSQGYLGDCAME